MSTSASCHRSSTRDMMLTPRDEVHQGALLRVPEQVFRIRDRLPVHTYDRSTANYHIPTRGPARNGSATEPGRYSANSRRRWTTPLLFTSPMKSPKQNVYEAAIKAVGPVTSNSHGETGPRGLPHGAETVLGNGRFDEPRDSPEAGGRRYPDLYVLFAGPGELKPVRRRTATRSA